VAVSALGFLMPPDPRDPLERKVQETCGSSTVAQQPIAL